MQGIKPQHSIWFGLALAAVLALGFLMVIPRLKAPPPQGHSWHVFAGSVSRAIVDSRSSDTRGRKKLAFTFLPNHIDFEATDGADIYVVRYPSGSARQQVDEMQRLTEELKAGRPPEKIVARGSGNQGRIRLNWWPYGTAKYLVLVRCEKESEVTLTVHYGP